MRNPFALRNLAVGSLLASLVACSGPADVQEQDVAAPLERAALSTRIRAGHEALFDRDEPVRALERFLASAVQ